MVTMVIATNTFSAGRRDLTSSVGMLHCHRSLLLRTILLLAALFRDGSGASVECVGALDQPCDSGLCFDAIHTVQGIITNGCATKELCTQTGCELTAAANGTELFVCCCENNVCNGKSRGLIQARFHMWKQGNYRMPPRVGHLMADEGRISTRHLQVNNTPTESTDMSKAPTEEAELPAVKRPVAPSADAGLVQGKFETTDENSLSTAVPQPVSPSPADTSITGPSLRRAEEDDRIEASHLGGPHVGQPIESSTPIVHSTGDQPVDSNAIFAPNTPRFTPEIREETSSATTTVRPATTPTSSKPTTTPSSTTTTTTTTTTTSTTTTTPSTTVRYPSTTTTTSTTTTNIPIQTTNDSAVRDNVAAPAVFNLTWDRENSSTTSMPNTTTDQVHKESKEITITVAVLPTNLILEEDEKLQETATPSPQMQADASGTANDAHASASFPWWIVGVLFLSALLIVFTVGSALIVIRERRSDSATLTGNVEEPRNIDPLLTHRSGD